MIDTHAHIDTEAYDTDRDEIIERAFESGLESIIVPGIVPKDFDRVLELTEKHEKIYCGIGIHPHNALIINEENLALIEHLLGRKKVVAVGEIGLDYYYDFAPKDIQKKTFREQIKIAKSFNKPIIVHNRDSDEDLLEIITEEQDGTLEGVLHCFSGTIETLNKAIELGFHVSFTGNITFKKSTLSDIVESAPMDRIMLETDSPYMTPVPHRGKRNEPLFVKYIAEKISEIKKISIDEVIEMTTMNAKRLFKLTLILFMLPFFSIFAQNETTDTVPAPRINRFEKAFGLGGMVGTHTIVQNMTFDSSKINKEVSYEGVFFYGVNINYSILDFLMLEAAYTYAKNTKIYEKSKQLEGPHIYQVLEFSSLWTANPYAKVHFYATLGYTMYFNTLNKGQIFDGKSIETNDKSNGFNFGVGLRLNIPIRDIGLVTPYLEWRINWAPTTVAGKAYDGGKPVDITSTSYYSMPRFGISFYPDFLKKHHW